MAEIQLVDVDGGIPETVPEIREEEAPAEVPTEVPTEVAPPLKRGRGRPPGAKNKVRPVPYEPAPRTPDPEPLPPLPKRKTKKRVVVESASDESTDEPPPPRKRRFVPTPPPDSPRTHRHKVLQNSLQQRADRHAGRVQEDSSMLHEMLAY